MPYAIELYFEKESAKKVQEMKTKLKSKGISFRISNKMRIRGACPKSRGISVAQYYAILLSLPARSSPSTSVNR